RRAVPAYAQSLFLLAACEPAKHELMALSIRRVRPHDRNLTSLIRCGDELLDFLLRLEIRGHEHADDPHRALLIRVVRKPTERDFELRAFDVDREFKRTQRRRYADQSDRLDRNAIRGRRRKLAARREHELARARERSRSLDTRLDRENPRCILADALWARDIRGEQNADGRLARDHAARVLFQMLAPVRNGQ